MARLRLTHDVDGSSRLSVITTVGGTEVEELLDGVVEVSTTTTPYATAVVRVLGQFVEVSTPTVEEIQAWREQLMSGKAAEAKPGPPAH